MLKISPYTVNTGSTDPPPTNCPDLPSLTNGMITYSAGSPGNRPVGSTATHSCGNGYTLDGEAVRTCVSGRTWSGSILVCQRK